MFARQAKVIADVRWSLDCDETYDWVAGNMESVAGLRCLHVAVSFSFGHFPQGSLKSVKGQPRTLRDYSIASEIFSSSSLEFAVFLAINR